MASGANNSVNLLSVSPRVNDMKSTRDLAQNSSANFGAQFKNELNKAQAKPAEKNHAGQKAREGKTAEEVNRADDVKAANSAVNSAGAASPAQSTEVASDAEPQNTVQIDANLLALLGASQLVQQTTPLKTAPELAESGDVLADAKTDPSTLAHFGKLSSLVAHGDDEQQLSQGDPQGQAKGQSGFDLASSAAKIAVTDLDATENLPLDTQSLLAKTETLFADTLSNKLNATMVSPVGVTPLHQSTPVQSAQSAANSAAQYIDTPVHDARWGDAVAQRVSMMLGKQEQQIEMQLNPPNLGPMEVRLNLGGEQASVVFTSQHAAVREALAAATPKLTALLADQGIVLQNVQVASDSLQQHQQNAFAQQQQRSDSSYQPSTFGLNIAQQNALSSERVLSLNELRVPVGTTRVSLFV